MSENRQLPEVAQYDFKGNSVRTICDDDGEIWFVATDVARILAYRNASDMCRRLSDEEKGTHSTRTPGGDQHLITINESGLYSCVLGSKKSEAKEFKRWVTSEVLPSIRKHGGYLTPAKIEEVLLNPDTIISLATQLKAERARRVELEAANRELAPRAGAWQVFCGADGDMSVADAAKALASRAGLDIGRDRLFEQMGKFGWLTRCHGYWEPLQYAVERGYVATRVNMPRWKATGESFIPRPTVRVTAKGLDRLFSRLAGDGVVC